MRREGELEPFLVAFPSEEGDGQRVLLNPMYFNALDEVGDFLAEIAHQYALGFVQSGRAIDLEDALEQIAEYFLIGVNELVEED